jgi:hypothetical protein
MSELTKVTATGLRHGLMNTVGNSVPDDGFKRFADKDKEKMGKLKKEEERMVEAQYLNKNGANERLERPYMNWAGQPITMWRFIHGEIYEVPKGLVDDVNDPNKRIKKRSGLLNAKGIALETDQVEDSQHRFVPVGF